MVWFLCILFINFAPLRFKTIFANHYLTYRHIILYKFTLFTFIYFFILIYFYLYRRKLLTIYLQLYQRGAAKGRASNFVRKLALVTRHFARKRTRFSLCWKMVSDPLKMYSGCALVHFQRILAHFLAQSSNLVHFLAKWLVTRPFSSTKWPFRSPIQPMLSPVTF